MKNVIVPAAVIILWFAVPSEMPAANSRPNIILMMADDLGWGDTGFNGNTIIQTPNLDELSKQGLRFTRYYAASAVCSPTRGACLTGRHPSRYGIRHANDGHLKEQEICLAEVLKARGYVTGHFGKWHLGTFTEDYSGKGAGREPKKNFSPPDRNGFDEWFSTEFAVATFDPYDKQNSHLAADVPWDPRALYWHNGKNITEPLTGDDSHIIMNRVIPFITGAAKHHTPFFAVIWFHAPHAPVVAGPKFRALYRNYTENEQHYYGCITALDVQVGRLRRELKELDADQNTLIWFASDNGPAGSPGPQGRSRGSAAAFRGRKGSLYEGGVRVPGFVVWPDKIRQPRAESVPCVASDYFPTILDVIGEKLPAPRPYDGVSLLPLLEGKMTERPRAIGFQFGTQAALSDNRYKLVHNTTAERPRSDNGTAPIAEWELYDLVNDPAETTNLAEKLSDVAESMKKQLAEWQASCQNSNAGKDYD